MNSCQRFLYRAVMGIMIILTIWVVNVCAQENNIVRISGSKYMYFNLTDLAKYYTERHPEANVLLTCEESHSLLPTILDKKSGAIIWR